MNNFLPRDGIVKYDPFFLSKKEANQYYLAFIDTINFQEESLFLFGKKIRMTRKTAFYGENGLCYKYSNTLKTALSWTKELKKLKNRLENKIGIDFNACLLNYYPDGTSGMGWHSDDESELLENGTIASISLGAERKFQFRHKKTKKKLELILADGSLLQMQEETQRFWQHQLPKMASVKEPRINLTFRKINSVSA